MAHSLPVPREDFGTSRFKSSFFIMYTSSHARERGHRLYAGALDQGRNVGMPPAFGDDELRSIC